MEIQRLFTEDDLRSAIGLYLEYIERYGADPDTAVFKAVDEIRQGYDASIDLYELGEIRSLPPGEIALRAYRAQQQD